MVLNLTIKYADVAKLADAHDSGSCGKPCRFKSCHPHQVTEVGRKMRLTYFFFTSTAMSCSDSRAKYSQGKRGRSPTGAAGSARADAHDSGSCGKPCRFKSCHPHQTRIKRTREKILSSFFLFKQADRAPLGVSAYFLQEIISDLKSNYKNITTFNRVF